MFEIRLFWFFFRAPRELDGHQGDAAGRNGVQCEVSGYDFGWPAERRRHGSSCHQEDCYHGQSPKVKRLVKCYHVGKQFGTTDEF